MTITLGRHSETRGSRQNTYAARALPQIEGGKVVAVTLMIQEPHTADTHIVGFRIEDMLGLIETLTSNGE